MRFRSVALGLSSIVAAAGPATSLTLEAAVEEALGNNPELRVLATKVETARQQAIAAGRAPFNPEIEFEEGLDRRFGAGQVIEWPGKRALREAIARKDVAAADAALGGFRTSLAAETTARFYELLAANKTADLRKSEVAAAERLLDIARRRVAQAFAPVTERSTAEVGFIRARRDLRETEKAIDQARGALASLLGRDQATPLQVEGELSAPRSGPPIEKLAAAALEHSPDVQIARHEFDKKRLGVSLARRERLPDVTLGPFYEIDTENPDQRKAGVGLKLPLPVWNTGAAGVAAAEAESREAEAALGKARRDVLAEVARAYAGFVAATDELALYSPELRARLETELVATERRYASGELPFLVLLEARRAYFEHVKDYYDALAGARAAEAELEKAAAVRLEDVR